MAPLSSTASHPLPPHVVITTASQWGQQAADHLLKSVVAHGGQISLVIPRRDEWMFRNIKPSYQGWARHRSVADAIAYHQANGGPIDYAFDDQLPALEARLVQERRSSQRLTVAYITSAAEDHFAFAGLFSRCCDRVLVEKPISRVWSDVAKGGSFEKLADEASKLDCTMKSADHYLFRPGFTLALHHAPEDAGVTDFLRRHSKCNLQIQFVFMEKAKRDDPMSRLGAFQDGAILDVAGSHGMGPVAVIIFPPGSDLRGDGSLEEILNMAPMSTFVGLDNGDRFQVPVLSETAAHLQVMPRNGDGRKFVIDLWSGKGCNDFDRYLLISCTIKDCNYYNNNQGKDNQTLIKLANSQFGTLPRPNVGDDSEATGDPEFFYGVSLGDQGVTVFDYLNPTPGQSHQDELIYYELEGGFRSDRRSGHSQAANAHAAMLNALIGDEFMDEEIGRFLTIHDACAIMRMALLAQREAWHQRRHSFPWGAGSLSVFRKRDPGGGDHD